MKDHRVAQMLAAEARLADGIEHSILGEQIDEPLHIHKVALGCLVRAPHEVFCVGCHCHLRVPASKLAYVTLQQLATIPF
jgi:hypothetical protein